VPGTPAQTTPPRGHSTDPGVPESSLTRITKRIGDEGISALNRTSERIPRSLLERSGNRVSAFFLWKRGWWILHVLAVAFMLWLGHFTRF